MSRHSEYLHKLDSLPGILDFRFSSGLSMYVCIRYELMFLLLHENNGGQEGLKKRKPNLSRWKIIQYLIFCFFNKPSSRHVDIIGVANCENNSKIPNKVIDFIHHLKGYSVNMWLYSPRLIRFGRFKAFFSFDFFFYESLLVSKLLRKKVKESKQKEIYRFIHLIKQELPENIHIDVFKQLEKNLNLIELISLRYQKKLTEHIRKINPGLILVSEGNNGGWQHAALFKSCRELGIKTAEMQHGTFGAGMKYAASLVEDPYFIQHKSEYILTFGPYHNTQTNLKSIKIPVGHYNLDLSKDIGDQMLTDKKEINTILYLCEGINYRPSENGLVKTLFNVLKPVEKNIKLILRIHPSENTPERFSMLLKLSNIEISEQKKESISNVINRSDIVIGYMSTALFEAKYFEKPVLFYRDKVSELHIPSEIGNGFCNQHELSMSLNQLFTCNSKIMPEKNGYWKEGNVIDNFQWFLKQAFN